MNLLKSHHLLHQNRHVFFRPNPKITLLFHSYLPKNLSFPSSSTPTHSLSLPNSTFRLSSVSNSHVLHDDTEDLSSELEDLAPDSAVYLNTLRLVECSMFAAVTGLAYFLSNSLSIENYFGCFFALPIVVSCMRWGVAAGRKTMVATAMLLLVLSGPFKALIYIFMHGVLGLSMGSLMRLGFNWKLTIFVCTTTRTVGALGYILTSSFLIRENILALITINIHTSLTFIFTAMGINIIPSMKAIYTIFGTLVLLNSGLFAFLIYNLYSIFLVRLGMKDSLSLPGWLEKALR